MAQQNLAAHLLGLRLSSRLEDLRDLLQHLHEKNTHASLLQQFLH
jgi:hypothetical protein